MKDNGGPAFPGETFDEAMANTFYRYGMTMRDYFAGQALASGLCPHPGYAFSAIPLWCYEVADAMLAERTRE